MCWAYASRNNYHEFILNFIKNTGFDVIDNRLKLFDEDGKIKTIYIPTPPDFNNYKYDYEFQNNVLIIKIFFKLVRIYIFIVFSFFF